MPSSGLRADSWGFREGHLGTCTPGGALAAPGDQARKADMDNVARVRQAFIRVTKAQRRIWLLQTIFLPVVAIGGIVTAIAVGSWVWRRRNATGEANDVVHVPPNGSGPSQSTEARLNAAPSGNLSG
jgi:hypothetical protein